MSIPDTLLDEWLSLASGLDGDDLARARALARTDPYAAKRLLARRIVEQFHDADAAAHAEQHFHRLFRARAEPDDVPTLTLHRTDPSIGAAGKLGVAFCIASPCTTISRPGASSTSSTRSKLRTLQKRLNLKYSPIVNSDDT